MKHETSRRNIIISAQKQNRIYIEYSQEHGYHCFTLCRTCWRGGEKNMYVYKALYKPTIKQQKQCITRCTLQPNIHMFNRRKRKLCMQRARPWPQQNISAPLPSYWRCHDIYSQHKWFPSSCRHNKSTPSTLSVWARSKPYKHTRAWG